MEKHQKTFYTFNNTLYTKGMHSWLAERGRTSVYVSI